MSVITKGPDLEDKLGAGQAVGGLSSTCDKELILSEREFFL